MADQSALPFLNIRELLWNLRLLRMIHLKAKSLVKSSSSTAKSLVKSSQAKKPAASSVNARPSGTGHRWRRLWDAAVVLILVPLIIVLFLASFSMLLAVILPFVAVPLILMIIYAYGPMACIALSVWRLLKRDYGVNTGDVSNKVNLTPALDVFYTLVICQGILCLILFCTDIGGGLFARRVRKRCGFPEGWGDTATSAYLSATRTRCWRDPMSLDGWNVIRYAASLLESQFWLDNLMGVRMLDAIIQVVDSEDWRGPKAVVRSVLLPSRATIKKLMCGPETNRKEHMVLAARIVAHLAGDIHLWQFPGAMQFICSLLQDETTRMEIHSQQLHKSSFLEKLNVFSAGTAAKRLQRLQEKSQEGDQQQQQADGTSRRYVGAGGCNELLLQGLRILEGLASDHQNCMEICATPALLTKVRAPLCSASLKDDIKISYWAQVVNGSLKVLHLLIRSPGVASSRLRRDIFENTQAMSNLKWILKNRESHRGSSGDGKSSRTSTSHAGPSASEGNGDGPELQIPAIEILTQLALDTSVKLAKDTEKELIHAACCIFIADGQAPGEAFDLLRDTAGRTLVLLSTNSEANSHSIEQAYDGILSRVPGSKNTVAHLTEVHDAKTIKQADDGILSHLPDSLPHSKNTVAHLTEMLDAKNNRAYRKIAAEILENLCTHSLHDDSSIQTVKESLLPKVLTELHEIPSTKTRLEESENSDQGKTRSTIKREKRDENQRNSAGRNDEESPEENSVRGNNTKIQKNSNEEPIAIKELQEAFLSLILAISVKLNSPDGFNAVVKNKDPEEFVRKLKEIVEENCEATADSLRIVKLCGLIAKSMMEHSPYTEYFRNKNFVESLSEALKIMSSLESCMLFGETDSGLKDSARPLLSDIQREVREMVQPK